MGNLQAHKGWREPCAPFGSAHTTSLQSPPFYHIRAKSRCNLSAKHQSANSFPTKEFSSGVGSPSAPKTTLAKWLFATILASQVTHGLLNLSVILLYRRLFNSSFAGRVSLVLSIWLALWAVSSVALAPFICTPPRNFWIDVNDRDGCVSRADMQLFLATFVLTHGILLWSFPLPFLFLEGRQISVGKKIGLGFVFVLGFGSV